MEIDRGPIDQEAADQKTANRYQYEAHVKLAEGEHLLRLGRRDEAERLMREAVRSAVLAKRFNPADPRHMNDAFRIGRRIEARFGCTLIRKDGSYYSDCPIQCDCDGMGLSWGGYSTAICSMCGEPSVDCPHIPGHVYDQVAVKRVEGRCNVCGQESCSHVDGQLHDGVVARRILTDLNPDHVSFVECPEDPRCMFTLVPRDVDSVLANMSRAERAALEAGEIELICRHCRTVGNKLLGGLFGAPLDAKE